VDVIAAMQVYADGSFDPADASAIAALAFKRHVIVEGLRQGVRWGNLVHGVSSWERSRRLGTRLLYYLHEFFTMKSNTVKSAIVNTFSII
jgi:hypothetical protein